MSRKNARKAISFGPRLDSPNATPSTSRTTQADSSRHQRVPTTKDVKKAYRRRQAVSSTASGVYIIHANSASDITPSQDEPGRGSSAIDASPARASSPEFSSARSSSPPTRNDGFSTPGWSTDYPDPSSPPESPGPVISDSSTQWTTWTKTVIPALIRPYLELMHRTKSLASIDRHYSPSCTCRQSNVRALNVTCVYFDGVFSFICNLVTLLTSSSNNTDEY